MMHPCRGAAALLFSLLAVPCFAQSHAGVRAGASGDPAQFFFGGHIETDPVAERMTFRPNVEVGVGDGLTLLTVNLELAYWLQATKQPWRVYLGGGPALIAASERGRRDGTGHVSGGFNVLLGAQHRSGLIGEIKAGFINSPSVKVTIGYAFH